QVDYIAPLVVRDLEVVSVQRVEKPKGAEGAIKVEIRVTKEQAVVIEKTKKQLVNWVEPGPGGVTQTRRKPVPLRLELHKSDTQQSSGATARSAWPTPARSGPAAATQRIEVPHFLGRRSRRASAVVPA